MGNGLRSSVLHQFGHCVQRYHLAGVRLHIDHLQSVGESLVSRQHLQQDVVLVGGGVDGGGKLRAEGIVQGGGDTVPVHAQGRRLVAVEHDVDARVLDLEI